MEYMEKLKKQVTKYVDEGGGLMASQPGTKNCVLIDETTALAKIYGLPEWTKEVSNLVWAVSRLAFYKGYRSGLKEGRKDHAG